MIGGSTGFRIINAAARYNNGVLFVVWKRAVVKSGSGARGPKKLSRLFGCERLDRPASVTPTTLHFQEAATLSRV